MTKERKTIYCSRCGAAMERGTRFCSICGAESVMPFSAGKEKRNRKILIAGIAAGAVLCLLIVAALCFGTAQGGGAPALYLKDNELYYADLAHLRQEPIQATRNLCASQNLDRYDVSAVGNMIWLDSSGTKLFYPDEMDGVGYSYGCSYYCRELGGASGETFRIDSNVISVRSVNDRGTLVTYLKEGSDSNVLYQSTLEDKIRIDSEIYSIYVSEDGKRMLYLDQDERLYWREAGKEPEKIANDVTYISYTSEDLSAVWYWKDNALYFLKNGKESVKVVEHREEVSVCGYFSTGEAYYTVADTSGGSLWDYFVDDLSPNEGERVRELIDELAEDDEPWRYTLYYFDGKKSVRISELATISCEETAEDRAVLIYYMLPSEKPKLSEMIYLESYDPYDIDSAFEDFLYLYADTYIAVGEKTAKFEGMDVLNTRISADGKAMYLAVAQEGSRDTDVSDLYRATISKGKISNLELCDRDVFTWDLSCNEACDTIWYFKEVSDNDYSQGDLYVDAQFVMEDVNRYSTFSDEEGKYLAFSTADNYYGSCADLYLYDGKKTVLIAEDVYEAAFVGKGKLLFLGDYSTSREEGDLFVYASGKVTKIDEDVSAIVRMNA